MQSSQLYNKFIEYVESWHSLERQLKDWKCRLPIIGLFFELRILNKMGKLTDEYNKYINAPKNTETTR